MKYRILTDGAQFKVQWRYWLFFWATVKRVEAMDHKDFGGDQIFDSYADAQAYIDNRPKASKWKVIRKNPTARISSLDTM